MTQINYIPEGYDRIKVVGDLLSFLTTDFAPKANVVLYQREIKGPFDRLADKMAKYFDLGAAEIFIKYSEKDKIEEFQATLEDEELIHASNMILNDMEFFYSARIKTHMRLLTTYTEHKGTHDFHVDGLEQDFDRYMTCYNDPVTQFVKNEDVIRVSGHDAICKKDAQIFQFNVGDIWKARVRNKIKNTADTFLEKIRSVKENRAFVHRAQRSNRPRLMVVGDKRL